MKASEIDWEGGAVRHWNLHFIDLAEPLATQAADLTEDMAQIHYPGGLIDIGWYPDCSATGQFCIRVVIDRNWERPTLEVFASTADDLLVAIRSAIRVFRK